MPAIRKRSHLHAATAFDKFLAYTEGSKSCWWWVGPTNSRGYGRLTHDYVETYAHRWSWDYFFGPIPEGMTIDHLCTNKRCVNPEHLDLVESAVNSSRRHGNRVFCPKGHSMADAYERPDGDGRMCRTCSRQRTKRRWESRTQLTCGSCGRAVSSENMAAHKRNNCRGNEANGGADD